MTPKDPFDLVDDLMDDINSVAEQEFIDYAQEQSILSQKEYTKIVELLEDQYLLYQKDINFRPGRLDSIIKGIPVIIEEVYKVGQRKNWFDAPKSWKPWFNKIDTKYRSCQQRRDDIHDRFIETLSEISTENVTYRIEKKTSKVNILIEEIETHAWLDVEFEVMHFEKPPILELRKHLWKYDAWKYDFPKYMGYTIIERPDVTMPK